MNKKIFRYFYILLIFLIIININMISADEINQDTDIISEKCISDSTGIEKVSADLENIDSAGMEKSSEDVESINSAEIEKASEDVLSDTNTAESNDGGENENNDSQPSEGTNANVESSDSTDIKSNSSQNEIQLKKSYLKSADYVIKSKYLNVSLMDSSKKAISNKKVYLTINGKTLYATTNSKGIAKFKISEVAKTYRVSIRFDGDSTYKATNKTLKLRVIAKPIYTKLTVGETGIIRNSTLKVYLKTKAGKAIAKQKVNITIDGKTYTRTTNKKGVAKLKINKKSNVYNITIKYAGKANYIPSSKKTKINVLSSKCIGKTSYGKVDLIGIIGNRSSKIKIAYVVGLHPIEHQAHESVYKILKNKVSMKYKYYIYKITLTKKSGDYSIDRMRGQKLAKKYIVRHAKKQNYKVVIDIHSTTGVAYAKTYFIHVPQNQHAASMKYAKKTIKMIQSIEKNSKMVYWSPQSQTSPPYLHLPLIKAGTPTFVFETWTYEKKSQTDKRAKILIKAVDKIFG